jgi:hypothetical protein
MSGISFRQIRISGNRFSAVLRVVSPALILTFFALRCKVIRFQGSFRLPKKRDRDAIDLSEFSPKRRPLPQLSSKENSKSTTTPKQKNSQSDVVVNMWYGPLLGIARFR